MEEKNRKMRSRSISRQPQLPDKRTRSYPLTRSWALIIGTFLSSMMWREQLRAMWSYKVVVSSFAVLALLLRIQSRMSLEEEVFKIGKQLEKIVGEEGTVSQWRLLIFYRPVVPREEPIHEDFNPAVYCKVKLTQSVCCLETSDVVIPTEFNAWLIFKFLKMQMLKKPCFIFKEKKDSVSCLLDTVVSG